MSVAEALAALSAPPARPCGTGVWLSGQPADEQRAVNVWAAAPRSSGRTRTRLHAVLRGLGYPYTVSAMNLHLRGACSCPTPEENL